MTTTHADHDPAPAGTPVAADDMVLTDVLAALSDPVRLEIVRQLAGDEAERTCGSFGLPVAKSTATHHFRVLREAGLVASREDGTRKFNRLRRADVDARFPGLLDSVLGEVDTP